MEKNEVPLKSDKHFGCFIKSCLYLP